MNEGVSNVTKEKVVFIAGPEFGDREGHLMKVNKALYGLRTSGARWHEQEKRSFSSLDLNSATVKDI